MKHMPMRYASLLLALCLSLVNLVADENPKSFLEERVEELLEILKSDSEFDQKKTKVSEMFRSTFDMTQLSGMALGRDIWLSMKNEDRKAFIEKYTSFLLSFYTSNMQGYKGEGIKIGEPILKSKGKKAEVPCVITVQSKPVSMTYSLKKSTSSPWKIYDVDIEGVRLSTQYRSQFVNIIKKKGLNGLLSELDDLIAKQSKVKI